MSAMIPISSAKVTKFSPTHTSHVITSLIFLNDKKTLRASYRINSFYNFLFCNGAEMTTHPIEIEGLPKGWEPISLLIDPDEYDSYLGDDGFLYHFAKIKLQKIKPREITLVETDELNPAYNSVVEEKAMVMNSKYIWRIKEE